MQRNHLVYHEQNPYICNKFDISCTFFALYRTVHKFSMPICQGSGCGSVSRTVTSHTRGCRFESNHRQNLLGTYLLSTVLKRRKRGRDWRIKNLFGPKMTHQNLWQKVFSIELILEDEMTKVSMSDVFAKCLHSLFTLLMLFPSSLQ